MSRPTGTGWGCTLTFRGIPIPSCTHRHATCGWPRMGGCRRTRPRCPNNGASMPWGVYPRQWLITPSMAGQGVCDRTAQRGLSTGVQCQWGRTLLAVLPAGARFFCFEPVSHPINAHHLPGRPGLRLLNRGGNDPGVQDAVSGVVSGLPEKGRHDSEHCLAPFLDALNDLNPAADRASLAPACR